VLLAENAETLNKYGIRDTFIASGAPPARITWTDDFASLWHVLRF
jgi:hypothetical protein